VIALTTLQWARASNDAFNAALGLYLGAMVVDFAHLAFRRNALHVGAIGLAIGGLAAHLVSIVSRGVAAGHVPWGTMWEYSSLLAFLVVLGTLLIVEGVYRVRTVTGWAIGAAVLLMAVAQLGGFATRPGPLQPALNSYWIKIHVVAAILGSSLFAIGGGVLSALYLVKLRSEGRGAARATAPPPIMGASVDLADPPHYVPGADEPVGSERRRGLLPPSAVLDRIAYRTIAFAFPIWTFAVIAGAIWAQEAWGRYWGWDPKETWSFITWTIYAGYLHARATAGWKGVRAAVIALVGFASLLVTFYVVNIWIVGLHGYRNG
jgi:cytochrome c-type biogenesis protein CcsB